MASAPKQHVHFSFLATSSLTCLAEWTPEFRTKKKSTCRECKRIIDAVRQSRSVLIGTFEGFD